jgi:hypothetical protein
MGGSHWQNEENEIGPKSIWLGIVLLQYMQGIRHAISDNIKHMIVTARGLSQRRLEMHIHLYVTKFRTASARCSLRLGSWGARREANPDLGVEDERRRGVVLLGRPTQS